MKQLTMTLVGVIFLFAGANPAASDTFGSGPNSFDIEFVTIGNPDNPADTTSRPYPVGSVPYTYRLGKYEISVDMVNKANAADDLGITFHDWWEPNKPAFYISWFGAAVFVNWLNENTQHAPAYKFDSEGNFQLWEAGDVGYDPENPFRNSQTRYILPSVDEWYKAAFYDAASSTYYEYPTGSNNVPDGIDYAGDTSFDAVFNDGYENALPNDIMDAGVLSPYGTMGQGGNAWEWEETEYDLVNDSLSGARGISGIDWDYGTNSASFLGSWFRGGNANPATRSGIGFRVASLPVPMSILSSDFDHDGDTDGEDFLKWQRNGLSEPGLNDWETHFGLNNNTSRTRIVPEPTAIFLMLMYLVGVLGTPIQKWTIRTSAVLPATIRLQRQP